MIFSAQLFCAQGKSWEKRNEEHLKEIRKIINLFLKSKLNKQTLIKLLNKKIKNIYLYDPEWISWNKKKDSGNLFIETEKYTVVLIYGGDRQRRDNNQPAFRIEFYSKNGFPISFLVDIFGKWKYYNEKVKIPSFWFEKKISNNRIVNISANRIYGPRKKPMKCICSKFSMGIEKIKNEK